MKISEVLQYLGMENAWCMDVVEMGVQLLVMAAVAGLVYWIAKKWLAKAVSHLAGKTATHWDDLMFNRYFFNAFALFIVPVAVRVVSDLAGWEHGEWFYKVVNIWLTFSTVLLISVILDGVNRIYDSYPVSRNRPIKVFIQVVKVFLYCVVIIVVISIIFEKDPESLLVGLSAFAAVLMLVFKDTILGFVAGVQLLANKMVNIGDWITISTIPTYKMVSESFTNWRGMRESNGRRIKRSVNIDVQSVHYLGQEELEELKKSKLLRNYITAKLDELERRNAAMHTPLDGQQLTNIGTFREYMEVWIAQNPDIEQGMLHFVRQLQPGPTGIPLEIYCFSARQSFVEYERVQADLFDHLFAVLPLFNLRIFQYPSDSLRVETFKS